MGAEAIRPSDWLRPSGLPRKQAMRSLPRCTTCWAMPARSSLGSRAMTHSIPRAIAECCRCLSYGHVGDQPKRHSDPVIRRLACRPLANCRNTAARSAGRRRMYV